jgi:hypothetical protein
MNNNTSIILSQEKSCNKCFKVKPLKDFWIATANKDGHTSTCIDCSRKRVIPPIPTGFKYCFKCKTVKEFSAFFKDKGRKDGYECSCKTCKPKPKSKSTRLLPTMEGHRVCTKCKQEKLHIEFYNNITNGDGVKYSICRSCVCKTDRRIIKASHPDYKWCAGCTTEKPKSDFYTDPSKSTGYSSRCKSCCVTAVVKQENIRTKTDPSFKLLKQLRGRINCALKNNSKSKRTLELIGCTIPQLKQHLQQTAIQNGYTGFDIESYSSRQYHIDHILPCASFDLSLQENQIECFHYSNLQILTARENIIKSDTLSS